MPRLSFDAAFAGPSQWASMYRALGLQVVPAHKPAPKPAQWKRPAIKEWKQFQEELIPFSLFDKWYGEGEMFAQHHNMGMITGRASNNVFVLDLDTYKGGAAQAWWEAECFINGGGEIPHSWRSRTGGGGRHLFFRAPETWLVPNNNTSLGVDIKGQGGFVVLPPSLHTDGVYTWESGYAPYEVGELEEAPRWLLDAIDNLAEMHGGHKAETRVTEVESTLRSPSLSFAGDINAWGRQIDGRETAMTKAVFAGVMELRRQHSQPTGVQIEEHRQVALSRYLQSTVTRLPGVDNITGLNIENRGEGLFNAKWARLIAKWGTPELEAAAARPNPKAEPFEARLKSAFAGAVEGGVERLNVREVKTMPDPKWLIEGVIPEEALGFIFGPPGSGKSFVALGQALALAMKQDSWWGQPIEKPGAVIYVSSEGHTDLKFRIMAWEAQHGVLADDAPFFLIRVPLNLMATEDVAKLLAAIKATEDEVGTVTAVYVDTVSRTLPGADENLQKDMTLFIAACDQIRLQFRASVIGVHHISRAGTMRGSTVFEGAADFLLQIEREEGSMTGTLKATKVKAAETWTRPFRLAKHDLPMGHSSLVALPAEDPGTAASTWPDKDVCRSILAAIGRAWDEGRPWSPKFQAKREGTYAPRQISIGFNVTAQIAEQMVTTWLENRVLAYENQGGKQHRRGLRVTAPI